MTVHLREGKATIPLWAAVTLIVTILLGVSGYVMYAVQRGADVEHRLLQQGQRIIEDRLMSDEEILTTAVHSNSDNAQAISAMKESLRNMEIMITDIHRRLR